MKMIVEVVSLFFLFSASTPLSTYTTAPPPANNSNSGPSPIMMICQDQYSMHHSICHDGATSTDCAIACYEAATVQASGYPGDFDIHTFVECCVFIYQLETGITINGHNGITAAAEFNNTEECFDCVGSNNHSMEYHPSRQDGERRMMREVANRMEPATPAGDFGERAPYWSNTTGG